MKFATPYLICSQRDNAFSASKVHQNNKSNFTVQQKPNHLVQYSKRDLTGLTINFRIEADTQRQIDWMDQAMNEHKDKIIELLIERAVNINPKVHRNYKG